MNVLCVVAHPDDEVLGCGGTLAKHFDAGDKVTARAMSCRPGMTSMFYDALSALGVDGGVMSYTDQEFDAYPLLRLVEEISEAPPADLVYTHNPDDLNLDHALTARAVLNAFRPHTSQASILAFETISSTEFGPDAFQPNHFEVLTKEHVDRKIRALDCYPSEVKDRPRPRNAEGVMVAARYRGQQICQPYAEAFRVLRSIR